jgi:hypothetical protein
MDKQLIDRLADAAGAESLAIYGAPSQLTGEAIERFATLVAEECAKIAATAEGETVCLEAGLYPCALQGREIAGHAVAVTGPPAAAFPPRWRAC